MEEIQKHTSQFVYLDVNGSTADALPTAVLTTTAGTERNLTVVQDTPPLNVDDRYHVVLTMADTQNEGFVSVKWNFDIETVPVEKVDEFQIITPYVSIAEVKQIWTGCTTEEAIAIEANVRHIIAAHTGQYFGKYTGARKARGDGSAALFLPDRLISLDTVEGSPSENYFEVGSNGHVLYAYPWGVPPVKADYYGLHMHVGGVIHNPNNVRLGLWTDGFEYEISGTWGWESVPVPVKEAAKLLINDYACADSQYRDRYLVSMTAADWRIQFASSAYSKTGNVRADQLLSDYVLKRGWAAI